MGQAWEKSAAQESEEWNKVGEVGNSCPTFFPFCSSVLPQCAVLFHFDPTSFPFLPRFRVLFPTLLPLHAHSCPAFEFFFPLCCHFMPILAPVAVVPADTPPRFLFPFCSHLYSRFRHTLEFLLSLIPSFFPILAPLWECCSHFVPILAPFCSSASHFVTLSHFVPILEPL